MYLNLNIKIIYSRMTQFSNRVKGLMIGFLKCFACKMFTLVGSVLNNFDIILKALYVRYLLTFNALYFLML